MNFRTNVRLRTLPLLCAATMMLSTLVPSVFAGDELISSMPDDTFLYMALDQTVLEESQNFTIDLIGRDRIDQMSESIMDWLSSMMGMDVSAFKDMEKFDKDAKEWMGSEIAVVVGTGVLAEKPEAAIVIEITSRKKAENGFPEMLNALKDMTADVMGSVQPGNMMEIPTADAVEIAKQIDDFKLEFQKDSYSGTTIYTFTPPEGEAVLWAATDKALIIAFDRAYAEHVIDALKGGKSISRFADFHANNVTDKTGIFAYMDAQALIGALDEMGELATMDPAMRPELDAIVAGTLVLNTDGLTETGKFAIVLDPAKVASTQYLSMVTGFPATKHDIDLVLNQDQTTFSMTLNNIDMYLDMVQGMFASDIEEANAEFEPMTGMSLTTLLDSFGGELGIALDDFSLNMEGVMSMMMGGESATSPAGVHTMAALQLNDSEPITKLLDVAMQFASQDSSMNVAKVDGAYLYYLPDPMSAMTLCVVPTPKMLGVGFGFEPEEVQARIASARGTRMPMASNLKVGMDMGAMAELLMNMMGEVEKSPMFGMATGAMAEEGIDYEMWKKLIYHGYKSIGNVTMGLSIAPDEIALKSVQVADADAIRSVPYEELIEALKIMADKAMEMQRAQTVETTE